MIENQNKLLRLNLYKLFFFLIHLLIFLTIIYSTVCIARFDVIEHDDISMLFIPWHKDFLHYLFDNYHGRTLINIFSSFIGVYLPILLNIHPIEWMHSGGAVFKGFFIAVICYQLSDLALSPYLINTEKKNLRLFYNILLALFSIVFYSLYLKIFENTFENELYAAFYGFTFPFIIYLLFWKKFIKSYLNDFKSTSIKKLSILAFFVGISSEFFSFSTAAGIYCIAIADKLIEKKPLKPFIPLITSVTAGFLIYVTNFGFNSSWAEKISNINITSTNLYFVEFLKESFYTIIHDFSLFIITIILLAFIITKTNCINKKKINIAAVSVLAGIFLFYGSLFFAGMRENNLFVSHFDIIVQIKIALTALIMIQTGFLYDNKKLYIILLTLIFFVSSEAASNKLISLSKLIFIKDYKKEYISENSYKDEDSYLARYINERIYLYNILSNKNNVLLTEQINILFSDKCNYIYTIYGIDINKYDIDRKRITILNDEELGKAYKIYIKNGGLEIEEFENKNTPNFNKLLDKKYIYQEQIN